MGKTCVYMCTRTECMSKEIKQSSYHILGSIDSLHKKQTGQYIWKLLGGACCVMVIVLGNGHGDKSSNPGQDCISHSTNILGKGMYPIILPLAMGK